MGIVKKQGIFSSLLLYIGFGLGALNVMYFFPHFFTMEQFGLTRLLFAIGLTFANLSLFGLGQSMVRFYPFYKDRLDKTNNDFLFLSLLVALIGFVFFGSIIYLFEDRIVNFFVKDPQLQKVHLVKDYFYLVYPLTFSLVVFSVFEIYCRSMLKTVFPLVLRDLLFRIFTLLIIVAAAYHFIGFETFTVLYCSYYFIAAVAIIFYVRHIEKLHVVPKISHVSKRLSKRMFNYSAIMFGGGFFGIVAQNIDTIMIGGLSEEELAGIASFTVATYIATIIQIPQRGLTGVVSPMIAQAWKDKNLVLISSLYKKTSINLMVWSICLFLLIWLNIDELFSFLPQKYSDGKMVVVIMSISIIVELSTGANSEILVNSGYWKLSFFTQLMVLVLLIPANYFMIKAFGIVGSAYSNLAGFFIYNFIRCMIIKVKYDMLPFDMNTIKVLAIALMVFLVIFFIPAIENVYLSVAIKSTVIVGLFGAAVIGWKVSEDVNKVYSDLKKKIAFQRVK
jgi:O-antigen/teichoic acid export membrane protein